MDIVVELAAKPTASGGGLMTAANHCSSTAKTSRIVIKKAERPPGKNSGSFRLGCGDGWTEFRAGAKGNMINRATPSPVAQNSSILRQPGSLCPSPVAAELR